MTSARPRAAVVPLMLLLATLGCGRATAAVTPADPLAAWNAGPCKQAILDLVRAATERASPHFVPVEDRIATFDQDGTLWVEHPLYTQAMFALDRVHAMAPAHPEWKNAEPFKAVLAGDTQAIAALPESDWEKLLAATHAGMTTEAFVAEVGRWLATARHPRFRRAYTELAYLPMLEVMRFLRTNGFKTYIVTGGGQEFVRAFAGRVYGIPTEQVIGSSLLTRFEARNGKPALFREPKVFLIDDHGGKPVAINLFIGKRPIVAFGNSSGDAEMLQWVAGSGGARLRALIHHDDDAREYAYGPAGGLPDTKVGTFPQGLMDEARNNGWQVVSMKTDWKRIFAFESLASR